MIEGVVFIICMIATSIIGLYSFYICLFAVSLYILLCLFKKKMSLKIKDMINDSFSVFCGIGLYVVTISILIIARDPLSQEARDVLINSINGLGIIIGAALCVSFIYALLSGFYKKIHK